MLIPLNQVVGIFRSRLGFRTPEGRGRHQISRVWRQKSSNLSQRDIWDELREKELPKRVFASLNGVTV